MLIHNDSIRKRLFLKVTISEGRREEIKKKVYQLTDEKE